MKTRKGSLGASSIAASKGNQHNSWKRGIVVEVVIGCTVEQVELHLRYIQLDNRQSFYRVSRAREILAHALFYYRKNARA